MPKPQFSPARFASSAAISKSASRGRCFSTTRTSNAAAAAAQAEKREGTIFDAFASLEGDVEIPLEPQYGELKKRMLSGREDAINASWNRLLEHLREKVAEVKSKGTSIVPEVAFADVKNGRVAKGFHDSVNEHGVCVIRGLISEEEAVGYKKSVLDYVKRNPHTKAFPANDPQVYELYWSEAQVRARSHPNMLAAQRFLMQLWHAGPKDTISLRHPIAYADRLRIRQPGDASFALGPHMDNGSLERWLWEGYGRGGGGRGVYEDIFSGQWEKYDPWDAGARLNIVMDLWGGVGNCSPFRMQQGWLAMSKVGANEGHLKVNPMLRAATAYLLLRPFFQAIRPQEQIGKDEFLKASNWRMEPETSSLIQGASPGHGQSLSSKLHPHLELPSTMIHMPAVNPGDYVAWHCDIIHAVDSVHQGAQDSSVLYIPVCPLTKDNAEFLVRQRPTFLKGKPGPDYGGGVGESTHVGRPEEKEVRTWGGEEAARAMGLERWHVEEEGLSHREKTMLLEANSVLGF